MKLVFLSDHMRFSGGRKLMFEYADFLKERGHDVHILVEEERGELVGDFQVEKVPAFTSEHVPESDLIIATSPKEVKQAHDCRKGPVVHFCQGFEITELQLRINGQVTPTRYQGEGVLKKLHLWKKRGSWKKKLKRFDNIYRLPTHLIAVSSHLKEELEERYGRPVHLCRNGIDQKRFHPRPDWKPEPFSEKRPMRIISVGPYQVTYKGIDTTLAALDKARKDGVHFELLRLVSYPSDVENESKPFEYKIVNRCSDEELAEFVRSSDVYVSNSTEREGFGLPAMEALSCGLLCVLSSITAYQRFSDRNDHCLFVPEGDVDTTTKAVKTFYDYSPEEITDKRKNALEVAADFSHEKACRQFEEILLELLK